MMAVRSNAEAGHSFSARTVSWYCLRERTYPFRVFRYHVNKALAVTMQERQYCETLLRMLQSELTGTKRKDLITKSIELILVYCSSFSTGSTPSQTKRKEVTSSAVWSIYWMIITWRENNIPTDCLPYVLCRLLVYCPQLPRRLDTAGNRRFCQPLHRPLRRSSCQGFVDVR